MSGNAADNTDIGEESIQAPAGWASSSDIHSEAFARVLLLGPMKQGKTTALLETSPGPVALINCDGEGAAVFPAKRGAKFIEAPCFSAPGRPVIAAWDRLTAQAVKLASEGKVRTIIVDTVTLLADDLLDEHGLTLDGYDKWNALEATLKRGLRRLMSAAAHVFIVAHMDPREDEISGILPLIPGKTKVWLPSKVADWVLFDMNAETGARQFVLGPQGKWTHSGRNIKRNCTIKPDVGLLLQEFGIAP